MDVFEVGTVAEPTYQHEMIIAGKADDSTLIHLTGPVIR